MISAKALDALLPQTQCGECGFNGCMPYAEALAAGLTSIDRCPPGGVDTLLALGKHLAIDPMPFLARKNAHSKAPTVAHIQAEECIGCTKCIQACPVDAIIGSAKQLHSVLTHECTGCGLCLDPCPVDCIELLPVPAPLYDRATARTRYGNKQIRALRSLDEQTRRYQHNKRLTTQPTDQQAKQDYILAALQRSQTKKTNRAPPHEQNHG